MEKVPIGGKLDLLMGTVVRQVTASAKGTRRLIELSLCKVAHGGKIGAKDLSGGFVDIRIYGLDAVPEIIGSLGWRDERIGTLRTDSYGGIELTLSADAFEAFWKAADAADGATRSIHLKYSASSDDSIWSIELLPV